MWIIYAAWLPAFIHLKNIPSFHYFFPIAQGGNVAKRSPH